MKSLRTLEIFILSLCAASIQESDIMVCVGNTPLLYWKWKRKFVADHHTHISTSTHCYYSEISNILTFQLTTCFKYIRKGWNKSPPLPSSGRSEKCKNLLKTVAWSSSSRNSILKNKIPIHDRQCNRRFAYLDIVSLTKVNRKH